MNIAKWTLRAQGWVVVIALAGSAVVIYPPAVEPFMLPKVTLLGALAVFSFALWLVRAVVQRRVSVPKSAIMLLSALFVVAAAVATATSSSPWASLIGYYGRYSGLLSYVAYATLFLTLVCIADLALMRRLARTAVAAAVLVVAYGLTQWAGVEPVAFLESELPGAFSTLGNVNFAGAWIGSIASLVLVAALSREQRPAWRLLAAVLLPASLVYAVATTTSQALVVALIALGFTGLVLTAGSPGARAWLRRHTGLAASGVAALIATTVIGVLVMKDGLRASLDQALVERPEFWSVAVDVWREHPVLGTGLDTYAHQFLAYRSAEHALATGPVTTDAPHSVPLAMLANGGLLLAAAYLAVTVATGFLLLRGVVHSHDEQRAVLAGWGGVWLGYQTQSLVSFDVPPLAVLNWLSTAVIVAMAAPPEWKVVALPGASVATYRGKRQRVAPLPVAAKFALGGVGLLSFGALWFVALPMRADLVAAQASPLTKQGQYDEATPLFDEAARLNPAEGSYSFLGALASEAAGRPAESLSRAEQAARRDPGKVQYALFAARQAQALGATDRAQRWYGEALARDPKDPPVLNEAAGFFAGSGQSAAAEQIYRQVLALDPANAAALAGISSLAR